DASDSGGGKLDLACQARYGVRVEPAIVRELAELACASLDDGERVVDLVRDATGELSQAVVVLLLSDLARGALTPTHDPETSQQQRCRQNQPHVLISVYFRWD